VSESKPPCDRAITKATFKDGRAHVWAVDCVLVLGHGLPHVTAGGQRFSDKAG